MDTELQNKISSFPKWHYQFDLNGYKTPMVDPTHMNRHQQRKSYFFRPLVDLLGGSLSGKRVLDLGCNAGFWSLCAVEYGCDYILGIDGRQMHIDQANLVFEVNGIDKSRYDFRCGNIFDILTEEIGSFDIVLCLGLMYHISKHIDLLELISKINKDILIIDTSLSTKNGSVLEVRKDNIDDPRSSCDYELVMRPTHQALLDMVKPFGYRVLTLKPNFTDYTAAADYKDGWRRAFIAAKQTALDGLSVPIELETDYKVPGEGLSGVSGTTLARALMNRMKKRIGIK